MLVRELGAGFTNLGLIDAGRMIANVPADATLDAATNLGGFAVTLDDQVDLTLSAAQATGRSITEVAGADGTVTVTDLEATPAADLSMVNVGNLASGDELALLDLTDGDVTFTGNLGEGFNVTVTDGDAPTDNSAYL